MSKVQVDTIVDKDDISAPTLSKGAIVTGVCTATTFVGAVTGNVTGNADTATNAQGLTGSPNITVTDVNATGVTTTGIATVTTSVVVGSAVTANADGVITAGVGTFGSIVSSGDLNIAQNIIHTGDTDTKIHFSAADQISFDTGGTTRLNITSSGNLEMPNDTDYIKIGASGDLQLVHTSGVSYISDAGSPLELRSDTLKIASGVGTEAFRVGGDGQLGVAGANYGTSGQVLTSGGSAASPSWATPSGGAWEWVEGYQADDAAPGTTGTVSFTGLSTAYAAYKVQVSHITFYGSGTSQQDYMCARVQSNGSWISANDYEHRSLRYDGGSSADGYGSSSSCLKFTVETQTDMVSGDLTIPMVTRKDGSGYSTPVYYGDFQTHHNRIMFGCKLTNADARTYGVTGIQVLAETYGYYTGRIDLYRLKRS